MKKVIQFKIETMKTILLLLFLCTGLTCICQEKYRDGKIIVIDFLKPDSNKLGNFYFKRKSTIRYKINNINKGLYNISLNSTASTLFTEKPTIFSTLEKIDLERLNASLTIIEQNFTSEIDHNDSNSIINSMKLFHDYKTTLNKYYSTIETYNQNLKLLEEKKDLFNSLISLHATLSDLGNKPNEPFKKIESTKIELTNQILSSQFSTSSESDVSRLSNSLNITSMKAETELKQSFQDLRESFSFYKGEYATFQSISNILETELNTYKRGLVDQIKLDNQKKVEADKKNPKQTVFKGAKEEDKNNLKILEQQITLLNVRKSEGAGYTAMIEEINNRTISDFSKLEISINNRFRSHLMSSFDRINESNYTYYSSPIIAENDIVSVKIDIQAKDNSIPENGAKSINGEYKGLVTGFKIDFSTGIFGIMGKNVFDQTYRLEPFGNDSVTITKNNTRRWIKPSIGALMHFYWKRPNSFNWGGNFGLSLNGDTNLNFHGGTSIMLGSEQRIVFSIGAVLSQAKKLSEEYYEGQRLTKTTILNPIPTNTFPDLGWFISFTYNLSN